jgi:hypothetical protein
MMKRFILIAAALMLVPGWLLAEGLGVSSGHDLDALWMQAQSAFDLEVEDAVILLESNQINFGADQSMTTRVHRLVWIGSTVGINNYADLRIPWNTATSTLDVEVLRTWRDGRWWPDEKEISDTAVVHTLPHRLDKADDYTTIRETMLLHDGVELGCIMETAYTIVENNVPAAGAFFVLPQNDPAVLTELKVIGEGLIHQELNGVDAPVVFNTGNGDGLLWQAELTPALGQPVGSNPEFYEATVVFSTWTSWGQLADTWLAAFSNGLQLDADQIQSLQEKLHPALGNRQKVAAVGDYLNEMVRSVHYESGYWRGNPRPASRTLGTAYGHNLDRAVLAAALLSQAGFLVEPMFIGQGTVRVAPEIPRLQGLKRLVLRIPSVQNVILDPDSGTLLTSAEILGHPYWYLGKNRETGPQGPMVSQHENGLMVAINLEKGEEDFWQGSGYFRGAGRFSQHGALMASGDLKEGYLSQLASSVIEGLKISAAAPEQLEPGIVQVDLEFEKFETGSDAQERKTLVIGAPKGGILSRLPRGVHLYDESRQTPVIGMENWKQTVMLRIEVGEDDLLFTPEPINLTNKAGLFELTVGWENGWLVLTRTLEIADEVIAASDWPQLRALLLEESNVAFGTLMWQE